jgi:hypothetical protein
MEKPLKEHSLSELYELKKQSREDYKNTLSEESKDLSALISYEIKRRIKNIKEE